MALRGAAMGPSADPAVPVRSHRRKKCHESGTVPSSRKSSYSRARRVAAAICSGSRGVGSPADGGSRSGLGCAGRVRGSGRYRGSRGPRRLRCTRRLRRPRGFFGLWGPWYYGPPGGPGGFPPPPARPPSAPAAPREPADPVRAVAVALLNLSGLGLGYLLIRRWAAMAVCWVATGVLLLIALPADPDGVSRGRSSCIWSSWRWPPCTGRCAACAPGCPGRRSRRSPSCSAWCCSRCPRAVCSITATPRTTPRRRCCWTASTRPTTSYWPPRASRSAPARATYTSALSTYRDLTEHHAGSKAGKRVPASLKTYYTTIGTPYDQKNYCDAITPLTYLRTVPAHFDKKALGSLAGWPDERLATSLYECGAADLRGNGSSGPGRRRGRPRPAAHDLPALPGGRQGRARRQLHDHHHVQGPQGQRPLHRQRPAARPGLLRHDPGGQERGHGRGPDQGRPPRQRLSGVGDLLLRCRRVQGRRLRHRAQHDERLHEDLSAQQERLLRQEDRDSRRDRPGQRRRGQAPAFEGQRRRDLASRSATTARTTSRSFTRARSPAASSSPRAAAARDYSSEVAASVSACKDTSKNYPHKTISLPPGTIYFLHKPTDGSTQSSSGDSEKIEYGYIYTECAYTVQTFGY